MDSGLQYIELKHWLIGNQKGTYYGPEWYAKDRENGIIGDVTKLAVLNQPENSWLLLLLTGNPKQEQWMKAIDAFNSKYAPKKLLPLSDPTAFPDSYFIGLLGVAFN